MPKGKVISIPCALVRGGTSKGVILLEKDLPPQKALRDKIILTIFGSPDPRQVDGLGGADPLTSKLAIISESKNKAFDINYTFGQVGIEKAEINYSLTCGNIAAGVALFAVYKKMFTMKDGKAIVRIFNTNTGKSIHGYIPLDGNEPAIKNMKVGGVSKKGTPVTLEFVSPGGMITGKLFPTENHVDTIALPDGKKVTVTVIDAGNVYAITTAGSLGIREEKAFLQLRHDERLPGICAEISREVAKLLLQKGYKAITPKVAVLQRSFMKDADIQGLLFSNGRMHKAYAVTGAINTACLLSFKGNSIDALKITAKKTMAPIKIMNPSGILSIKINYERKEGMFFLSSAFVDRTARLILEGKAYVNL